MTRYFIRDEEVSEEQFVEHEAAGDAALAAALELGERSAAEEASTRFDRFVRNGWSEEDAAAETGFVARSKPGNGNG